MHDFPLSVTHTLTCLQTSAEWTERKKVTYGLKLHHLRQTSNQSELLSFLFILVPFLKKHPISKTHSGRCVHDMLEDGQTEQNICGSGIFLGHKKNH